MSTPNLVSQGMHNNKIGSGFAANFSLFFKNLTSTKLSVVLLALIMALPLFSLIGVAVSQQGESFEHIRQTVLSDYIVNTLILVFAVGVMVVLIGVPLAWLTANCKFWGRGFFSWALVLPLAMPGYIIAYVYTDLLDFAGPIQIALREKFGWSSAQDYWFFDIRTIEGAAIMLALVLFPYVYLMARAGFLEQHATLTHAARSLGMTPLKSFWRVSLPLARKSIVAGTALVMMETMADFATVDYFAVSTLTTAVYDTWLGHYDLASAAKLSSLMVLGVFALLYLEKAQGRKSSQAIDAKLAKHSLNYHLGWFAGSMAFLYCSLILILAFVIPAAILANYGFNYFDQSFDTGVFDYALSSISIAACTALLAVVVAMVLNYTNRIKPNINHNSAIKLASTGYAIPGTVLAIGVIIPLGFADRQINDWLEYYQYPAPGLILSGTVVAIIFAHVVRFSAIANNAIEAGYRAISPSMDMVTRTLGRGRWALLSKVHFPLLKRSTVVAALLIFVESMKELPAALLLRPFDFQTLPTYVYQFASDEQLELASLGAILIVVVGLVPLLILNRSLEGRTQ